MPEGPLFVPQSLSSPHGPLAHIITRELDGSTQSSTSFRFFEQKHQGTYTGEACASCVVRCFVDHFEQTISVLLGHVWYRLSGKSTGEASARLCIAML
jgi:hypothetical protein